MKLKRNFFNRDTNIVAQELLGKLIVVKKENRQIIKAMITETEAYHGYQDRASHASRKKTERNKIMFDKAGLVYIYLIYGIHYCLNFVTMKKGFPAAVLIRSILIENSKPKSQSSKPQLPNKNLTTCYLLHDTEIKGPGKITKYLGIDKGFYGEDLTKSKKIWIESVGAYGNMPKNDITKSKRIGVDYARESASWLWNYKIKVSNT